MRTKLLLIVFFVAGCFSNAFGAVESMQALDARTIITQVKNNKAKLKVVNLWASWCSPCREELPSFAKVEKQTTDVQFFYISGDEDKEAGEAAKFIEATGVGGVKFRLSPIDEDAFHQFSPKWSGSLPTTFIYKGEKLTDVISRPLTSDLLAKVIKFRLKKQGTQTLPESFFETKLKSSQGKK